MTTAAVLRKPAAAPQPNIAPVYLIEVDFGSLGTELVGDREKTKNSVIADIISGEFPKVLKVLEIFEDERTVNDVTADIAVEIANKFSEDREPVNYELCNWLHKHHPNGVLATRGLIAECM